MNFHKCFCDIFLCCELQLSFRQNPDSGWILMRTLNWISVKSLMGSQQESESWLRSKEGDLMNQDPTTNWVLFL